ncbi:MAG: superoxide dismutase [Candidatus Marinimicrobia bacterium]|nr:superoxide dismutase [Candidatus Neomarinimicrobiota bacterium]
MKKTLSIICLALFISVLSAHCEIPCGIYGDSLRVALIREHVETIEKSMSQIEAISKDKKPDYNQLVRWVTNKEEHAEKIQEIVTQYFLFQRVIPAEKGDAAYESYTAKLDLLHKMAVSAMKCKQTTDKSHSQKILYYLSEFEELYFHKHGH